MVSRGAKGNATNRPGAESHRIRLLPRLWVIALIAVNLGSLAFLHTKYGLVNLIAGKGLAPELIQEDATSQKIADTVYHMVQDEAGMKALKKELLEIKDKLGGPGAAVRTADIALKMMDH